MRAAPRLFILTLAGLAACGDDPGGSTDATGEPGTTGAATSGGTDEPGTTGDDDDSSGAVTDSGPGVGEPRPPTYANLAQLHEKAIAPTCSLNNGVCHNSQAYPDVHTTSTLLAAMGQPCNTSVDKREEFHDFCEPEGDRLVIASAGLDLEIARVAVTPADGATDELTEVTLTLAAPVPAAPEPMLDGDVEVRRGDLVFPVGGHGVKVLASDATTITLSLAGASPSARAFFDDRAYPWHELMVRVGDVNANGTLGHDPSVAMIVPGDPMKSYMVLRLIDDDYGDLMPRQCRTWNDEATRALGCFIAGLAPDVALEDIDPLAPIDYDNCAFDPIGLGICGTGATVYDVFARACGGSACHVDEASPAAGLDLSAGVARDSLVDVMSTQAPGMALVAPGLPEESYLLCKIDPACAERTGALMPSGADALAAEDIALVRAWIEAGAE